MISCISNNHQSKSINQNQDAILMFSGEGRMIPEHAQKGLEQLGTDIANYLNGKKEDIKTTTSKNGAIINNIYNYGAKPVSKFNFFSTVGIIVTMILCGIALAIGWTLITNPDVILRWFGI